ncbi:MAG: PPC domain-containing DNA-binding protein [Thermoplasmatota archaeon]
MEHVISGSTVIIRMGPGEDYIEQLTALCSEIPVETAVVLSSIGQMKDFSLGYFVGPGDYSPDRFQGPHELLSVSGIISRSGEGYTAHLHAVLGGPEKNVVGGHLLSGKVEITNETVLLMVDAKVSRRLDPLTGLLTLAP